MAVTGICNLDFSCFIFTGDLLLVCPSVCLFTVCVYAKASELLICLASFFAFHLSVRGPGIFLPCVVICSAQGVLCTSHAACHSCRSWRPLCWCTSVGDRPTGHADVASDKALDPCLWLVLGNSGGVWDPLSDKQHWTDFLEVRWERGSQDSSTTEMSREVWNPQIPALNTTTTTLHVLLSRSRGLQVIPLWE